MWLINAETLTLKEFVDDRIPEYNILSHTWENDEVTFQDIQAGSGSSRSGWDKIVRTCKASLNPPLSRKPCQWVWIDTCCIDKSSSAQLSEAINSTHKHIAELIALTDF